jgi:hypothetical protein
MMLASRLVWAAASFRAARQRDRLAGSAAATPGLAGGRWFRGQPGAQLTIAAPHRENRQTDEQVSRQAEQVQQQIGEPGADPPAGASGVVASRRQPAGRENLHGCIARS